MVEEIDIADFEKKVPELSGDVAFYDTGDGTFVIQERKLGYHLKVNSLTVKLLNAIDGKRSIREISEIIGKDLDKKLDPMEVYEALYGTLASNGIIKSNIKITTRRDDYLKLRIPLFKEKYVSKVSHLLIALFHPGFFKWSFLAMFLFLAAVFTTSIDWKQIYNSITPASLLSFYIISFVVTIFHELGHVTACRRFGASHGDIGFAFYIFTPVFYADVTNSWRLNRSQRIIIDMAGVYMQFLISSVLSLIFLMTSNNGFLIYSLLIVLLTISNLNPLFRYDAYWALSDYLNINNLRSVSNKKLSEVFHWFRNRSGSPLRTGMDLFLFIYAILSLSLLIAFLLTVLFLDSTSILTLPSDLYRFFEKLVIEWNNITFEYVKARLLGFLIPVTFYVIVIRLIIKNKGLLRGLFKF